MAFVRRHPGCCLVFEVNVQLDKLILTIVTFTPAGGAGLLMWFNRKSVGAIRAFSLVIALLTFLLSLHLIAHFDSSRPGFQYLVQIPWIPSVGIDYHMGIDGVS